LDQVLQCQKESNWMKVVDDYLAVALARDFF